MKPKQYSSEGLVLAKINYSEADRILVVYSKNYGKLSLIAKSVRKPKSRKRGALDVFNRIKFSAARGKNLDIMTEAELIDPYKDVREDLKRVSLAYYFMEVVGRLTQDEEENREFYSLVLDYLSKIEAAEKLKKLRKDFIYNSLVMLGFWPKNKAIKNHDKVLEEVIERELNSVRVGKKMLS